MDSDSSSMDQKNEGETTPSSELKDAWKIQSRINSGLSTLIILKYIFNLF